VNVSVIWNNEKCPTLNGSPRVYKQGGGVAYNLLVITYNTKVGEVLKTSYPPRKATTVGWVWRTRPLRWAKRPPDRVPCRPPARHRRPKSCRRGTARLSQPRCRGTPSWRKSAGGRDRRRCWTRTRPSYVPSSRCAFLPLTPPSRCLIVITIRGKKKYKNTTLIIIDIGNNIIA